MEKEMKFDLDLAKKISEDKEEGIILVIHTNGVKYIAIILDFNFKSSGEIVLVAKIPSSNSDSIYYFTQKGEGIWSDYRLVTISPRDFKEGDFITSTKGENVIGIFNKVDNSGLYTYTSHTIRTSCTYKCKACWDVLDWWRPSTENEKSLLLNKLREEGYVWDKENLKLEKVGETGHKKFEPFEKVIIWVRGTYKIDFFSCIDKGEYITLAGRRVPEGDIMPYEGNEHIFIEHHETN